jgi:hypothetical protein
MQHERGVERVGCTLGIEGDVHHFEQLFENKHDFFRVVTSLPLNYKISVMS